ncbi:MAG TPA: RHS repeat-associated core domain-containing protein [Pyrinomonadaceae bacterium]
MFIGLIPVTFGQVINQTHNKADQILRSTGRVNPSTLGMEISIPLGGYAGRAGNDKPLTLEYSSKVWSTFLPDGWQTGTGTPVTDLRPYFAKKSVSGWTSSLGAPVIEFSDDIYTDQGRLWGGEPYTNPYYVKRVTVTMPDGSAYNLRQDDNLYVYNWSVIDRTGTYLSVDGSKMRLVVNSSQSIFYLPDGGRIFFDGNYALTSYIDRSGNKITYAGSSGQWTDTLGRILTNPLLQSQPTEGTQVYQFQGFNGLNQQAQFIWAKLSTQQPSPAYMTNRFCLSFTDKNLPTGSTILFTVVGIPTNACDPFTTPFDPIVLTEVRLQNGSAYKFHYNLHAEIDKIEYPTGGYERFEYGQITPVQSANDSGYDQFNRGVKKRWISSDGTTTAEVLWKYDVTRVNQGLSTDYYKIRTTAPDNSYTERYLLDQDSDVESPYGFGNIAVGRPYEERAYSKTGQLLRRNLTEWTQTGALPGGYATATRDMRPRRAVEVIFEENDANYALIKLTETEYEQPGQNNVPTDSKYFAANNVKRVKTYHYKAISKTWAADNARTVSDFVGQFSGVTPASIAENDYFYDPVGSETYLTRNITGLVTEQRILDPANSNAVVAKTQIFYDEATYQLPTTGTMPTGATNSWVDLTQSNQLGLIGSKRGLPTTIRSYRDVANNLYIETRKFYDQYGNLRKARDGRGNDSEIEYSEDYAFAYPTKTTTAAAGTDSTRGATSGLVTTMTYDFNKTTSQGSGLPVSTTDPNGLKTVIEYDAALRPWKVTPRDAANNNIVGAITETDYGVPDSSGANIGRLSAGQRFVHSKTQIDAANWAESWTWFDGLGRTVKTQKKDSAGDVFAVTSYDEMGRVKEVSNPFRNVSSPSCATNLQCTTTTYDAAGRLWKVTTPDGAFVETTYNLATTGNQIGTVVTVKDQASKERRSITNALGQLMRVDEPDVLQSNQLGSIISPYQATVYSYDPLSNLKTVTQGSQTRSFVYDSLSRLKSATNPESGLIQYGYDNNGNLTSKTDARLITTTYSYDNLNRLLTRSYQNEPSGQAVTREAHYYYDNLTNAKGKLIKVITGSTSNQFSVTEYQSFDIFGRVTQSQQKTDGTVPDPMTYTYNLAGMLVEEKYPSGRVVKNVLDADGDLSIVQSKKNANSGFWNYAQHFSYTATGAVSSMQLGNGTWESTVFDNYRLQPTQIALGTTQNQTNLLQLNYTYNTPNATDNNGNVLTQKITVPSTAGQSNGFTAVQTYSYDSLNRLKQAGEKPLNYTQQQCDQNPSQCWKQTYKYDRFGNREFDAANTTTLGTCPQTICNPTIDVTDNRNRFKLDQNNDSINDYGYDAAGNLTKDAEGKQLTYDGENKQTEVKNSIGQSLGKYFYDADGQRVKKVVSSTGETTIFVYDVSGKLVAEYSTVVETANPKVGYLTNDHLGSPRIITDRNGNVTSRRDFLPFGEEIAAGTGGRSNVQRYDAADNVRQKFTSYERDNETGLDFAQARMHNYNHGRFTSPDPLMASAKVKNPQTFNRYSYVLNNPLNLIDPLGLSSGCPEGKKCEIDDNGNEYYIEDGNRVYVDGEVGTVNITAEDAPVTVGFVAPILPKVVEKVPWWKTWITRPIGNGAKGALKVGGAVLFTLFNPASTSCGASPGMVSDGNGGCMKNPTRVDQDTDEDDKSPVFVRFGPGPETLDGLRTQAEAAEASGYPYGVSVFLLTPPIRATDARQAPVPIVNGAFEVRRTGSRPNHYTVIFPKPLTQDTVNLFNTVFSPR